MSNWSPVSAKRDRPRGRRPGPESLSWWSSTSNVDVVVVVDVVEVLVADDVASRERCSRGGDGHGCSGGRRCRSSVVATGRRLLAGLAAVSTRSDDDADRTDERRWRVRGGVRAAPSGRRDRPQGRRRDHGGRALRRAPLAVAATAHHRRAACARCVSVAAARGAPHPAARRFVAMAARRVETRHRRMAHARGGPTTHRRAFAIRGRFPRCAPPPRHQHVGVRQRPPARRRSRSSAAASPRSSFARSGALSSWVEHARAHALATARLQRAVHAARATGASRFGARPAGTRRHAHRLRWVKIAVKRGDGAPGGSPASERIATVGHAFEHWARLQRRRRPEDGGHQRRANHVGGRGGRCCRRGRLGRPGPESRHSDSARRSSRGRTWMPRVKVTKLSVCGRAGRLGSAAGALGGTASHFSAMARGWEPLAALLPL